MLVSGLYDLSGTPASFLQDETRMTVAEAEARSPLTSQVPPLPIRIVTRGALETAPFHDQAVLSGGLLAAAGQRCVLRREPGLNHLSSVLALANPASTLGGVLADLTVG